MDFPSSVVKKSYSSSTLKVRRKAQAKHKILMEKSAENKKVLREKNPKSVEACKYGVIMIDPFPNKDHDVAESGSGIMSIAGGLLKALRNQVMFNQDGILDALDMTDRTKFLIEPSDMIKSEST